MRPWTPSAGAQLLPVEMSRQGKSMVSFTFAHLLCRGTMLRMRFLQHVYQHSTADGVGRIQAEWHVNLALLAVHIGKSLARVWCA